MKVLGFLRALLGRRDWVYLLSLMVPFTIYNLTLKTYVIGSQSGDHGLSRTLDLMRSDVFFNLGYALLWIGLFAAARRGFPRRTVVVLFHATTVLVVAVVTCAHWYFQETGTILDYGTIAEWLPRLGEIVPILVRDVPLPAWMLLAAALFYAALGPWLLMRIVGRERSARRSPAGTAEPSFLGSLGLLLLALGFGSLSLLIGLGPASADKSLARDPFVNVVLTGVQEATAAENDPYANLAVEHPAMGVSLAPTPGTEKRNVVLIHLESTRAQSVTPYNEHLNTTPFLDELAESSLLAERAHVVLPRSSKASVAVNCGIDPPLQPGPEFEPGGIPARCLADLLKEQDYDTVFFASTSDTMDGFGAVVRNLGYEEYYPSESMDREGFQVTNIFGYEDDIMLEPSEQWLKNRDRNKPFLAEYFTGTGHDDYRCLSTRYGSKTFAEDELLNRYLNCLRLQDIFLQNLMDQYKELGLYENTIFILFGDHGEGFSEHGRFMHGDTIWEEGLRVPLIIHDPKRFEDGERVEGLSNQTDILPTVLEMLGYEVENGRYPGYSLLHPLPGGRTLMFSCISERRCLASIRGTEKYIYHYGEQPEEVYDLSEDPLEEHNLAGQRGEEELHRRREEVLAWRSRTNAVYEYSASAAINLK